jgi:hypothetical protein
MPIDHCIACKGTDLYRLQMFTFGPVVLKKSAFAITQIPVNVSVCLACGVVTPYVGERDIKSLQGWKKADDKRKPQKAKTTEKE